MAKDCSLCLWSGNCDFERPCKYYTPIDYEERIAMIESERTRMRYYQEMEEYMAYHDDEGDGVIFFTSE